MKAQVIVVALASALAGAVTFGHVPSAQSTGSCSVQNDATAATYEGTGTNLERAIVEASSGDVLVIEGRCLGRFTVAGDAPGWELTLQGSPTERFPVPTLDADLGGRTLTIRHAGVTIVDLAITGGAHVPRGWGGGVWVNRGSVTLNGTTSVFGNRASDGGGIFNFDGTVTLNDSASVTNNRGGGISSFLGTVIMNDRSKVSWNERWIGGGIRNNAGTVILNDSASVRRNTGERNGGGLWIWQGGTTMLNDSASVVRNISKGGGGIYVQDASLILNGAASVVHNRATKLGGGILARPSATVYLCSALVRIGPNNPDDPPETVSCS